MRVNVGVAAIGLGAAVSANAESIWSIEPPHVAETVSTGRNRVLETVDDKMVVTIDFDALVGKVNAIASGASARSEGVTFAFPDGEKTCNVQKSSVLHPDLAAKVPELKTFIGSCSDGSVLSLNYVDEDPSSVTASFEEHKGDAYFVDSAETVGNKYFVYRKSSAKARGTNPHEGFRCGNHDHMEVSGEVDTSLGSSRRLRSLQSTNIVATTFQAAFSASDEYSQFHGDTLPSVLNAIATMLNRVNGVYIREMGVYFQLFPDNDKIICLTTTPNCNIPNTNANSAINGNAAFISARTQTYYDIGHVLTTGSGGLAAYPGLCDRRKAAGTTGSRNPINDPFWIDYVAHELGHQLLGAHSFRDCDGSGGSNNMVAGAVEPGGGTSIMGYAGICPGKDVQMNSDPYFNSNNLVDMRALVQSRVANVQGCGTTQALANTPQPKVVLPIDSCTVPVGNYVTLTGDATGPTTGADWAYAWDRVDRGYEPYLDRNTARFRSWKPTSSKSRNLPNLYYILFDELELETQLSEIAPKQSQTMTFRFIARTEYETTGTADSLNLGLVGAFDHKDVSVRFTTDQAPLQISTSATTVSSGKPFRVTWNIGGTASLTQNVVIEVAQNTMSKTNTFDYEMDLKELDWQSLGTFPNNGAAEFTFPNFPLGSETVLKIRSTDANCAFFDLTKLVVTEVPPSVPTETPTKAPTKPPTPTKAPTKVPTASPTTFPTKTPIAAPTTFPTQTPIAAPTGSPVNLPTKTPTHSPTDVTIIGPTKSPSSSSSSPTTSPTSVLDSTLAPTSATVSPTSMPDANASTPTVQPTAQPTALQAESEENLIFGISAVIVYVAGGGIFVLLSAAVIAFTVSRKKRKTREQVQVAAVYTGKPHYRDDML